MPTGRLAAVEAALVDGEMAGIEGRGELTQGGLLARPWRTFEQDHRAPAMRNLRLLQIA